MMQGLHKLTAIANNMAAREDWERLVNEASAAGYGRLVDELRPPIDAGWRRIDKQIAKLREALQDASRGSCDADLT